MRVGYRVSVLADGSQAEDGLPRYVFCDATLGESLDRIKRFIEVWCAAGDPSDGETRHLHLSIFGPLPEDICAIERKTPEQRLEVSESPDDRAYALAALAKSRFEAGRLDESRAYLHELQALLPDVGDTNIRPDLHATVDIVLGRLALREGNVDGAKHHLANAGRSSGSPVLCSFGPNMSLARDLLLVGENQAVLDYFRDCAKFWEMGRDTLEIWAMYVDAGRIPDFGANLDY